jgi:DNA-binding transcriptional LysR family regulator
MIAVRLSPGHRPAIVGSPAYFEPRPKPKAPRDLLERPCINFRHGSAGLYRWEFEKGKKSLSVALTGPLIVDDVQLILRAALDGVGLAWVSDEQVMPHLATGALVRVLERGASRIRLLPLLSEPSAAAGALAALIDILRM